MWVLLTYNKSVYYLLKQYVLHPYFSLIYISQTCTEFILIIYWTNTDLPLDFHWNACSSILTTPIDSLQNMTTIYKYSTSLRPPPPQPTHQPLISMSSSEGGNVGCTGLLYKSWMDYQSLPFNSDLPVPFRGGNVGCTDLLYKSWMDYQSPPFNSDLPLPLWGR